LISIVSSKPAPNTVTSRYFNIQLERSAAAAAIDDRFRTGPLRGQTVNVKWYFKQEGLLDMSESTPLDYYFVLTGPPSALLTSRGGTRPWRIDHVYLFHALSLLAEQRSCGVKAGIAASIRKTHGNPPTKTTCSWRSPTGRRGC
jgi:hypothetical protein